MAAPTLVVVKVDDAVYSVMSFRPNETVGLTAPSWCRDLPLPLF